MTFRYPKDYDFHLVLRAIENNTIFSKVGQYGTASPDEYLVSVDQLLEKFENYPQLAINTQKLIEDCNFHFDFASLKNKESYTGNRYSDKLLLENLAYEGMNVRYGKKIKRPEKG